MSLVYKGQEIISIVCRQHQKSIGPCVKSQATLFLFLIQSLVGKNLLMKSCFISPNGLTISHDLLPSASFYTYKSSEFSLSLSLSIISENAINSHFLHLINCQKKWTARLTVSCYQGLTILRFGIISIVWRPLSNNFYKKYKFLTSGVTHLLLIVVSAMRWLISFHAPLIYGRYHLLPPPSVFGHRDKITTPLGHTFIRL